MIRHTLDALKRLGLVAAVLVPTLAFAGPLVPELDLGGGAPAPVHHYGASAMGAPIGGWDFGLLLALDLPPSPYDAGPRISFEAMHGMVDLAPNFRLDFGGRFSFAAHSAPGASTWLFDIVPDLKLLYAASDVFAFYGDFGMGLGIIHTSVDFAGSDTTTALAIQLGLGGSYALSPNLNLLGEVRFDIYSKSGSSTFVAIPTIGLQWH